MNKKLDFDATKLFEALKYQILVAMEYCHTLADGEELWIEVSGDVTVAKRQQIEVKYYDDDLTDSHQNFWNTLNNWLKPEFAHHQYQSLVLLTTQNFGAKARLAEWDAMTVEKRIAILEEIRGEAEARHTVSRKSQPSKSLELQRKVLSPERRMDLKNAVEKTRIVTDESRLEQRITRYKREHLRPIYTGCVDSYLDDMFGFLTATKLISEGWKISGSDFTAKVRELTARYMFKTIRFPKIDRSAIEKKVAQLDVEHRLFARKLTEIDAGDHILEAISDILHAESYMSELIGGYEANRLDLEGYFEGQHKKHIFSRKAEISRLYRDKDFESLKANSKAFLFTRCSRDVEEFCTYTDTPIEFRNGVDQMLADEEPGTRRDEFHWRLWA
ncbi:hypothetical protein FVF58_44150 [Paraburkholderia panacisoli]|uniref:CD-NTase associated protein 4-like DNA endonuclease domain-containing protein n=1 Tax=Paraburkholderia panacisoli TaxID=2603818 RepID=A0A5B0G9D1_9BURK|nr:hypothetical protein [Paraburkholderia panacisoli]KAA0998589.1 hypothetical protein FVF58_44150 [Paraburkholderia panacisoli]